MRKCDRNKRYVPTSGRQRSELGGEWRSASTVHAHAHSSHTHTRTCLREEEKRESVLCVWDINYLTGTLIISPTHTHSREREREDRRGREREREKEVDSNTPSQTLNCLGKKKIHFVSVRIKSLT
jgi:hypothetical protein